jgi:exopolyphosphatase/guanosine-5'-triphosphate,3'-diphosphate pyrophosphatase
MNNSIHPTLATADLGSNSFRLQVARVEGHQIYPLDSLKETVRLGAGLDQDKNLSPDIQAAALAALARFGERLRGLQPEQVRIVGTNTLRVAKNGAAFIAQAEEALGFPIDIIAGREEARLIYLGAAHSLPNTPERRLVVDIGGGSTEFIIGQHFEAMVTESLPLGCVSYSLRFFPDDKYTAQAFALAVWAARDYVQRIVKDYPRSGWDIAVGTSGTARSLRDILQANDWGAAITLKGLLTLKERLIKRGSLKNLDLKGLREDRMPVLAGGLAVMLAVFEELEVESMQVVDGALRDGVLYDMLGRYSNQDMRDTTVNTMLKRSHAEVLQANRVKELALNLYARLSPDMPDKKPLIWAALLHEIGLSIAHAGYHKHSAYVIEYADMVGFSLSEQRRLARIVLSHRGDMKKNKPLQSDTALWLAVVSLRLAVLFLRSRNGIELPSEFALSIKKHRLIMTLPEDWLATHPLTESALRQEIQQWEKVGLDFLLNP